MEETSKEDRFDQALANAVNIIVKALDKFAEYVRSAFEAIIKWFKQFSDAIYQWYLDNGAKYGETQEGCQRWFEELVSENRLKQEAEARALQGYYLEEMRRDGFELGRRIARGKLELEE